MILLLVVLLGMYLRGLRTANIYEAIKLPLFRKEGGYLKLISPNPSLQKRGFFYDVAFSDFIGNIFERVKTENVYGLLSSPLFCKEGLGEI